MSMRGRAVIMLAGRAGDADARRGAATGEQRSGIMLQWRWTRRSVRTTVLGGLVLLALLVVAKIHACACTGGPPEWTPVYPTSQT
ncbi:MAG TPA: hypothetical protein PLP66_09995 [Phycisphaerae bacterium]|nr:hypothetical protein [Phycisphaerae bacterium]